MIKEWKVGLQLSLVESCLVCMRVLGFTFGTK